MILTYNNEIPIYTISFIFIMKYEIWDFKFFVIVKYDEYWAEEGCLTLKL